MSLIDILYTVPADYSTSQTPPGITRRLCTIIIGILVDYHRLTYHIDRFKPICKKGHLGTAVVRKQHRKIAGMVAMGLVIGIPMLSCRLEGVGRIPYFTAAKPMDVKPVGSYRVVAIPRRLVWRKAGYPDTNYGAPRHVHEQYLARYLGC
jgi:hypothetical protein